MHTDSIVIDEAELHGPLLLKLYGNKLSCGKLTGNSDRTRKQSRTLESVPESEGGNRIAEKSPS
jgi:hypothetical protein